MSHGISIHPAKLDLIRKTQQNINGGEKTRILQWGSRETRRRRNRMLRKQLRQAKKKGF
jgi:hypothetical protein